MTLQGTNEKQIQIMPMTTTESLFACRLLAGNEGHDCVTSAPLGGHHPPLLKPLRGVRAYRSPLRDPQVPPAGKWSAGLSNPPSARSAEELVAC